MSAGAKLKPRNRSILCNKVLKPGQNKAVQLHRTPIFTGMVVAGVVDPYNLFKLS